MSTTRSRLLYCGAVGALLLLAALILDGATRPHYDPLLHGVSQLTLGDHAWTARATFVAAGLLLAAFTIGFARALHTGPGAAWGPRFTGAVAAGLAIAGIVPTDPALGYPPGAPEGMSASGAVHQVGGALLFIGLTGAAFAQRRWFAGRDDRAWATYSLAVGILVPATAFAAGIAYRLLQKDVVATAPVGMIELVSFILGFTWIATVALRLSRGVAPA